MALIKNNPTNKDGYSYLYKLYKLHIPDDKKIE